MIGEIVTTPIPYTDLNGIKRRPVLIVAEVDAGNRIICAITAQGSSQNEYIPIEAADMADGKLRHKIWARTNHLYTLNENILTRISALNADKTEETLTATRRVFQ